MSGAGHEPRDVTAQAQKPGSDVGPRVRSAMILIPLTLAALFLGHIWFALAVAVAFAGAYREWDMMVTGEPLRLPGLILVGLIGLGAIAYVPGGVVAALALFAVAAVFAVVLGGKARWWRAAGVLFIALVTCAILEIRDDGQAGIVAGLFLGISVWGTDSAAFFTGRQVGGAKMSPDISPSKTWSGAIGGLMIGTLAALVIWIFGTSSPWWIGALLGAAVSISGQIGDLAESALKRRFRIKDSGDIIPGHGGLMDRLDSLTFAILICFAIGTLHQFGMPGEGFVNW